MMRAAEHCRYNDDNQRKPTPEDRSDIQGPPQPYNLPNYPYPLKVS